MEKSNLKKRLFQAKDVKALKEEELSQVAGGDETTYETVICPICHQEVSLMYDKCPFCRYPVSVP